MAFDYQRFIQILSSGPTVRPSFEDRVFLNQTAKVLIQSFDQMENENNKAIVLKDLQFLAKKVSLYKACFVNSLLYNITKNRKYFRKTLELLQKLPVSIEDHTNDFWALSLLRHEVEEGKKPAWAEGEQRRYLKKLLEKTLQAAKPKYEQIVEAGSQKCEFEDNPRVVIITSQFLMMGHAPTEIALNYANILQKDHNKEVLIVNGCEYSKEPTGAVTSLAMANVKEDYSNFPNLSYEGETIALFQPQPAVCSDEGIYECIRKIDSFDPALIIVVGNTCSFAELFLGRSYVIYSPTVNSVPYAIDAKFHMHDAPGEESKAIMEQEGILDNYEFFLPGGYEKRAKVSSTSREELGLPLDRPVFIIVGNRLNLEITDEFLCMINNICLGSNAFFFFLGEYNAYGEIEGRWPAIAQNSIHHTYLHDIMAVYEHCDVYVNPKRQGGGTSGVYAMQAGMPVLSLPFGDVSFTAEQFPELVDYKAMEEVAVRLAKQPEVLEEYKGFAEEGCEAINGLAGIISKILEHYDVYIENGKTEKKIAS